MSLPTGTVTFLFTDIEGSTRLVQGLGDRWVEALEEHNRLVRQAIEAHRGVVVKTEGDSFFAVFESAIDGALAAGAAQEALESNRWPEEGRVRARMGLHTGVGALGSADYVGLDVHRAARIADAAHGGQTVLSESTAVLIERSLPPGLSLHDLGKFRLKDLSEPETIFELVGAGREEEFPVLRTLDAVPNNLPMQVTSFVGRERELSRALDLLERTRVLTLTGPGGTGKTRLALQVAAEAADQFRDGVFFVDLAPVSDVDVFPSQVLAALGIQGTARDESPTASLIEHLRSMAVLVVLDNFEQLIDAASLVADMSRASPGSKFIVTSRAPLRITGEQEMPVPPLEVAEAIDLDTFVSSEAVVLFCERAMAVRPDFAVDAGNASTVADLIRMLDGLPLAIELVASRLRHLPVGTILERLDTRMLSGGSVDLPERQRTIESAIAWSYDLLDDPTATLFARFAVFAGDARLEEAEKVCDPGLGVDLIDGLGHLIDQSLLRRLEEGEAPRFRMLHVIQEFAIGRLEESGEAEELRRRHLVAYVELAEMVAPELLRKDRKRWLDVMERDHDNIRAALEWGVANGDVDLVLRLTASAWRFWQARGHLHEARRRIEGVLAVEGGDPALRAKALEALGGVHWWQGRMEDALSSYGQALELQRQAAKPKEIANALYNYGLAYAFGMGRPVFDEEESVAKMRAFFDEAQAVYEDLGDVGGLGDVAWGRGSVAAFVPERADEARGHFEVAIGHYRQSGNEFGLGWSLYEVAEIARRASRIADAWPYTAQALELFAGHRDLSAVVLLMDSAAAIALSLGDVARAVRLAGATQGLRAVSGTDIIDHEANRKVGLETERLERLTGDLGEAYHQGLALDLESAVAYALEGPTDADFEPGHYQAELAAYWPDFLPQRTE